MATLSARNSFGTYISFAGTTAGTPVGIAGILNVSPPSFSKDVLDITNHGTTDGYTVVIPSKMGKTGPVQLQCIYLTSSSMMSDTILDAFEGRTKGTMYLVVGGSTVMAQISMEGYVIKYGLTAPLNDKVTFEMTFKPTGTPTVATATTGY